MAQPLFRSLPMRHLTGQGLSLRITQTPKNELTKLQKSRLGTFHPFREEQKPKVNPGNPSLGGASFRDLGATRAVKIVVITMLCVAGTVETVFWVKVLMRRFGWDDEGKDKEGGEGESAASS